MAKEHGAIRAALFVEEGFEDLEFWVTYMRMREVGAQVRIVGIVAEKRIGERTGSQLPVKSLLQTSRPTTSTSSSFPAAGPPTNSAVTLR